MEGEGPAAAGTVLAVVLDADHLQTFDATFASRTWAMRDGAQQEAAPVDVETSAQRVRRNASDRVVAAAIEDAPKETKGATSSRERVALVSLDSGELVGCVLQRAAQDRALGYRAADRERFESRTTLPYPAASLSISSDGALVVVDFGANNQDDPSAAAMIVALTTARIPGGDAGDWQLQLQVVRYLSRSYVTSIPGTLVFRHDEPRELLCAWSVRPGQVQAGALKLAHSEVVQQVEGRIETKRASHFQRGAWTPQGDALVLVGDACHLFLFAPYWLRAHAPWHRSKLEHAVDFIEWDKDALVLVAGAVETGAVTLLDRLLQPLVHARVDFPLHILDGTQIFSCAWLDPAATAKAAPIQIAVTCDNGQPLRVSFPMTSLVVPSAWRSIVGRHLQLALQEPTTVTRMRFAAQFALGLGAPLERRLGALLLVARELSKAAQRELVLSAQDKIHASLLETLEALSLAVDSLKDAAQRARYTTLLATAQRRYISDRLRLGQLERACQFAHKLAADLGPTAALAPRFFDAIAAWSEDLGQASTIGRAARAAARKLRGPQLASPVSASTFASSASWSSGAGDEESGSPGSERGSASSAAAASVPTESGVPPESAAVELAQTWAREMDVIWREWRRAEVVRAATAAENDLASPRSLEGGPEVGLDFDESSGSEVDSRPRASLVDARGLLCAADAARLGLWLECRGKLAQAGHVYRLHRLEREERRLDQLQKVIAANGSLPRLKRLR